MEVMHGKLNEEFEVAQAEIERKAEKWGKGRREMPPALAPRWDCDPGRIYLAYDGDAPGDHSASDFVLIEADVAEVHPKLTYQAGRDKNPWHKQYKSKSIEIAYRWLHGLQVSPPVIAEHQGEIVIVGGMHRYHLAHHYGTQRMPFYARKSELGRLIALLPSATLRWEG